MRDYLYSGWILLSLSSLCAIGCGGGSPNVPASGRISVKGGLPLDEGKLVLIPEPADPKKVACGATVANDGKFACNSATGGLGVPPGKYKVVLAFNSGKGAANPFTEAFQKYTDVKTTPLIIDVPASGTKDLKIELDEPAVPGEKDHESPAAAKTGEATESSK